MYKPFETHMLYRDDRKGGRFFRNIHSKDSFKCNQTTQTAKESNIKKKTRKIFDGFLKKIKNYFIFYPPENFLFLKENINNSVGFPMDFKNNKKLIF